jgi:hypothetical protein
LVEGKSAVPTITSSVSAARDPTSEATVTKADLDVVGGRWAGWRSMRSTANWRSVHDGSVTQNLLGDECTRFSALPTLLDVRQRWFSRRALLLHLTVILVAPACLLAAWWQATRALGGNTLSWFYSVEWPVFAVLAVVAWWHLIHEDPEAYRARKQRPPEWDDI